MAHKFTFLLSFRCMIIELYSKYRLNFIRNCQTGFPNDFIILYFHQQYVKYLVVPCIYQHLTLSFWIILGNLVCVCNSKYFYMVLICISIVTNEVVHFSICLMTLCIVSLWEITMLKFCPFFHWIICLFNWFVRRFIIFKCKILCGYKLFIFVKIFTHPLACLFILLIVCFDEKKFPTLFNFHFYPSISLWLVIINYCLPISFSTVSAKSLRNLCLSQSHEGIFLYYLSEALLVNIYILFYYHDQPGTAFFYL